MVDSTPESFMEGVFPPGDPTLGFEAVLASTQITNNEDVGFGFFDRVHQLLGSERLIGVCEG